MNKERTYTMKRIFSLILTILLFAAVLIGCNANDNTQNTDPTDAGPSITYIAKINIKDYGTITVQLDHESAPKTVDNFVKLANSGFYDGLTFHRIIEGFMMQGGAPKDSTSAASTIPGEFAANGYNNKLSHTRGVISMARSQLYDSASSQFFIVHKDYPSLDGLYAAFGYVIDGIEVVDAVCEAAQPIDNNGKIAPEAQPVISSITILTQEA